MKWSKNTRKQKKTKHIHTQRKNKTKQKPENNGTENPAWRDL